MTELIHANTTFLEKYHKCALHMHDCGFNITTCSIFENEDKKQVKRPYIPTRGKDKFKWSRNKPMTKEEITKNLEQIKKEGKQVLFGFFPGEITHGKYKGKYSWSLDFDEAGLVKK